jgi:hypothetical protein
MNWLWSLISPPILLRFSWMTNGPGTFPFDPAEQFTNTLLRGSIVTYAGPETETLKKSNYAAHFDNFTIAAVEVETDSDPVDKD